MGWCDDCDHLHHDPLLEMDSLGAVGLVARVRLPSQPMTEREQRGGQLDRPFSLPL